MRRLRWIFAIGIGAAIVASDIGYELGVVPQEARLGAGILASFNPISVAEARIGRPLTPLSYAGTARRVTRRTARRVARRTAYRVSVLPGGCIYGLYYGAYYYRCGGVYYERAGGVYVQVVF
jgi:hypothetical protein